MFSKRIIAKLIDIFLFAMLGGMLIISIGVTIDSALSLGIADQIVAVQESLLAAGDNTELVNQIISDNYNLAYGTILYSSIMGLLVAVLYFGVIGKALNGSIGKKIVGIKIVTKDDSLMTYIKREPVIHISILSLILLIMAYFIPNIMLFDIFTFVYLLLFALDKDFWNKRTHSVIKPTND